jgi:hypothetical protein
LWRGSRFRHFDVSEAPTLANGLEGPHNMATQSLPFRLTAVIAGTGLVFAQLTVLPAAAQEQPPPGAQDQQAAGDPPERVGRLARASGTVSFHTQDEEQWSPATVNYPITAGNALWTDANAQAEIEISASRIAMAPGTELDVATLSDTAFQATEPQGEIYLRVRAVTPDETYAVQTPRGLVTFASPGRYAVAAGDTQTPTAVTVIEGSAQVTGPDMSLQVGPSQTAMINGTDTLQGDVGPAQRDAFLTATLDRERPQRPQAVVPPRVVAAMPGGEDLAAYGTWTDSPQYGQVWYPQVAPDWVPYREGRWDYVAPWGWTWVDSAPWGFAPFHYGRWVQDGGRWGWYPGAAVGVAPIPVYAPALVTFFGVGAVVGIGVGAGLAGGRIGWFPLGPREVYRPWYHASDRYVRQVNVTHVTNVTSINTANRNVTVNNFANRGAATVVPTSALTESRPVRGAVQRVDAAQLAQARPVFGQQPLRPTVATAGVTPAVARQFNLAPTQGAVVQRPVAPGPAIRPAGPAPGVVGATAGGRPSLPPLHDPAQPTVPAAAGTRPFTGQPPPAEPGSRPGPPAPGAAPGAVFAPNAGRPAFGGAATPQAAPALRPPAAPGQIAPPPIQRPPGGGGPAAAARPVPTPGAIAPPGGGLPPTGQPGGTAGPAAISRPMPQLATPAAPAAPPAAIRPAAPPPVAHVAPVSPPEVHAAPSSPPPVVRTAPPPAAAFRAPPALQVQAPQVQAPQVQAPQVQAPRVQAPPPQMHVASPPPPPVVHTAPPPAPAFRAPPAPQVQAPPPQVHVASPPPPQFHPPPPPAARAPSPPPAAPAARPPPPQQQAQPQRQKRPGEP